MTTSRPMPSLHVALALTALALAGAAHAQPAADAPSAELPVTRLVLSSAGVGYFEHAGTVVGTQELELRVAHEHMDDLLASLVLEDHDGGTVRPVRYGARDPLARVLGSYALDLSHDPTLAQLLSQARGESLRVEAGESLVGVLVNVERVAAGDGSTTTLLTLSTAGGLRRVALEEVRALRFERASLRAELDAALAAIARARDAEGALVRLRFEGEGERRVRVAYVREMPIWKPSYRLVLRGDGSADLQGWAILDNPTALDLVDVSVAFVAGRPISFVSELFESVYAPRARVGPSVGEAVVPPVDAGAFARPAPAAAPTAAAEADMAAPRLSGAGVSSMAEGVATAASFSYVVQGPVSVGRYESAMIPIVVAEVEAPRSSFLALGAPGGSPLLAVRLVNDTGLHLAAGPVTIYDEGGFAGNALLGATPPGEERLLSFAVDLDLRASIETASEPERVTRVSIREGLLESFHRLRVRSTITASGGEDGRFLVVELPLRPGYEVVAPALAAPATETARRFGLSLAPAAGEPPADPSVPTHASCAAAAPCRLEVVEERLESRTVALTNVDPERLVLYLENVEMSDEDRAVLERVVALRRRLAGLAREAADVEARIDAVFRDQARVRQNMGALDRNSSLYRRYLADLEEQEDEVDALGDARSRLLEERRAVQEELEALVAALGDGDQE